MSEQGISMLGEHEAPDANSTTPSGYTPTPGEKKTIKMVTRLFEKSKAHKKKYDAKWMDYYKMFRGKQWKESRPSYRHSEVINMIFQNIQSMVPTLTDSRPKISFVPQEPSDFELSEILNQVSQADWERNNWLMVLTECIYDAHFYGTMLGLMEFYPEACGGLGDIRFESADPFYCFPDPEAREVNDHRSRYFIYAEPVNIEVLRKAYPDKAKYLKPDLTDLGQGDKTDLDQVRFKSPTDTRVTVEGDSPEEAGKDKALKITCWIKDDEITEEQKPKKDEQGNPLLNELGHPEVEYEQKLKYPQGRKIVIACGILLSDGPNPYEDGLVPYAKGVNYILPREFWGMSEIEQLASPQKIFNKLVSFALDVLTLMGNPIWVVDSTSGVDTDNLFNRPGLIVEKEPGSEVRREEGVQLQPYVLQLIDRMKVWFDDISGNNDVSRGSTPGDVTAGTAINALMEAAKTRARLKSRLIDAFLQQLGQLYQSRVFQFYTAPRMFRVTNNQNVAQFFKMHVDTQMDEAGNPVLDEAGNPVRKAVVTPYTQDPATGQYAEAMQSKEYPVRGKFDVRVTTGSSLPFAKQEKSNLAFKLLETGVIDAEEVLRAVDYPNAEAVIARMKEKAAAMPPAPGPQGPPQPPAA